MKVRVVGQRCAALAHKLQRPLPVVVRKRCVGGRAAHLGQQGIGHETSAECDGHQVLYQHIQRRAGRVAVFNAAFGQRLAGSGGLHQFQTVRGHQRDAAGAPRRVAGSARALHQPCHALGRADLQHLLHRQKVHAQVQARCAHHRFQGASLQPRLHPAAHLAAERAMVQGNGARPVGPRLQQRLVPALGLRAGVGEEKCCTTPRMPVATCHRPTSRRCSPCQYLRYWRRTAPCAVGRWRRAIFGIRRVLQHQRRRVGLDGLHHLRQQRQAHVPGPGKTLHAFGQQHLHLQRFVDAALHQQRLGAARRTRGQGGHQGGQCFGQVAQRGRHAPHQQARVPARQARQRQLHLHAALVAHQLVPFVHHHQLHAGQALARVGAGQQQRHAFRRGDQHRGQAPVLRGALAAGGVSGAQAAAPVRGQVGQGLLQGAQRVSRQRAHGRDPQHRERRGLDCFFFRSCLRNIYGR